jgi:hypothetical protein
MTEMLVADVSQKATEYRRADDHVRFLGGQMHVDAGTRWEFACSDMSLGALMWTGVSSQDELRNIETWVHSQKIGNLSRGILSLMKHICAPLTAQAQYYSLTADSVVVKVAKM